MLNPRFADVFANGWRVLFTQAQLAFYQVGLWPDRHHLSLYRDGARASSPAPSRSAW